MNTTTAITESKTNFEKDPVQINGTDFIEMYVGNSRQAAYYFMTAFGFKPVAYTGLETNRKDTQSFVVEQGKIRIILTSPLKPHTPIGKHIDRHGDGVKYIAFWVDDSKKCFDSAVSRGAEAEIPPHVMKDRNGQVTISGIKSYGETVHLFVERNKYSGPFLPGYKIWNPEYQPDSVGLKYIDHMVGNVGWNEMNTWVQFYEKVLGFTQLVSFDDKDISTEYTALMSKVMANGNGRIKFPINEPAKGKKKSQVEEYLDFYDGPGVQHIAVATDDIVHTVTALRRRGVEFLEIPSSYYVDLLIRVGNIDEELSILRHLGILVDRDEEGYLLQIFTKPLVPRPTLFFEIIQRKGATSFGKGNFKALFEAIEREQKNRGTL